MLGVFRDLKDTDKKRAVESIVCHSSPSPSYFMMISLSILMAAFGLLLNNPAVIIGSMLIAPLLYPVLGLGLGLIMSDGRLINRSFITLLKSILISLIFASVATLFFGESESISNSEILSRIEPSLLYFCVSIIAGLAASYAIAKSDVSETLPGVAISVALIPPLAVAGIGVAHFDWEIISGALVLFILNALGIVFASMVNFSLMDFAKQKKVTECSIDKEDRKIAEINTPEVKASK